MTQLLVHKDAAFIPVRFVKHWPGTFLGITITTDHCDCLYSGAAYKPDMPNSLLQSTLLYPEVLQKLTVHSFLICFHLRRNLALDLISVLLQS